MTDTVTPRRGFLKALSAGLVGASVLAPARAAAELLDAELARAARFDGSRGPGRALADAYMLDEHLAYLNHASIGTVPRAVHEAHVAHLALCESNPSLYVWGPIWRTVTEDARRAAAELLACAPDDLAITHSTTEGFNVLAAGLGLEPGDEVLFSDLNHPGASVPWERRAPEQGYSVRRFPFPVADVAGLSASDVVEIHRSAIAPRTRVLVFPHVDNVVGLRHPLADLARMAHREGVEIVAVDGAQSAGMIPVDLRRSGVDAYAMSPHKWLQSPKGLGLFYTRAELRERLTPLWHRSRMSEGPSARRYEDYSTRAWPAVVALGDALAFQIALGQEEKERRYREIRRAVRERVSASHVLHWRSPHGWDNGSVIVAVEVEGRSASDLARRLMDEHRVSVRGFGTPTNTLRLSPNVATPWAHLERCLEALERWAGSGS